MEGLIIKNFKCYNNVKINMNKLTVIAGANSRGKSTAIQALLLLRRTIEDGAFMDKEAGNYHLSEKTIAHRNIELNKSGYLCLGNSSSIIPFDSDSSIIEIGIERYDGKKLDITYDSEDHDSLSISTVRVWSDAGFEHPLLKQEFYYLNTERIGPRFQQEIRFQSFPNSGYQGEYTAQLLGDTNFNQRYRTPEERMEGDSKSAKLEEQVNAWMNDIFPGTHIRAQYNPQTLTAQIIMEKNNALKIQAPHMGFGMSYALPIIVNGLIAAQNSFMIIENPEAHLHPAAQSKIGRFLAVIANAGVQVLIETHSEHILNSLQLAVMHKQVNSKDIIINFLSDKQGNKQPEVEPITIDDSGELSGWPQGFFDQSQRDLGELFRLRQNV